MCLIVVIGSQYASNMHANKQLAKVLSIFVMENTLNVLVFFFKIFKIWGKLCIASFIMTIKVMQ